MQTDKLISPKMKQAAEGLVHPLETEPAADVRTDMPDQEARERGRAISARFEHLIWKDRGRNLDGRTLPEDWREPVSRDGYNGRRTVDASPWIDIDTYEDGRAVQAQLQTWRDQLDCTGEGGEVMTFSSAEQPPVPSVHLRVRSSDGKSHTTPEEAFRVTGREIVLFHGKRTVDANRFEQLEQLLGDLEAWRSK